MTLAHFDQPIGIPLILNYVSVKSWESGILENDLSEILQSA